MTCGRDAARPGLDGSQYLQHQNQQAGRHASTSIFFAPTHTQARAHIGPQISEARTMSARPVQTWPGWRIKPKTISCKAIPKTSHEEGERDHTKFRMGHIPARAFSYHVLPAVAVCCYCYCCSEAGSSPTSAINVHLP